MVGQWQLLVVVLLLSGGVNGSVGGIIPAVAPWTIALRVASRTRKGGVLLA